MTLPTLHPRTRHAIDRALRAAEWVDGGWASPSGRFARAMLDEFRASLGAVPATTAAYAAFAAARHDAGFPAPLHEAWGRATLLWSAREVLRAAANAECDADVRADLTRVATQMLTAAAAIVRYDASGAPASWPAIARPIDATLDARAGDDLAAALVRELRHAPGRMLDARAPVDEIARDAVVAADRALRRRADSPWTALAPAAREAATRAAVVDAALAVALAVPADVRDTPAGHAAQLALARSACRLAACAERAPAWIAPPPVVAPHPATPTAARPSPEPARTDKKQQQPEAAVKDTDQKLWKTLETDATDAAWRTAGAQFVKLAREPLVAMLSRHLGPDDASMRARVAQFLETELGTAILASLLSLGLSAVPVPGGDVAQRLSRELRVRAISDAGNLLAELLTGPLREVVSLYLRDVAPTLKAPEPASLEAGASAPTVAAAASPEAVVAPVRDVA